MGGKRKVPGAGGRWETCSMCVGGRGDPEPQLKKAEHPYYQGSCWDLILCSTCYECQLPEHTSLFHALGSCAKHPDSHPGWLLPRQCWLAIDSPDAHSVSPHGCRDRPGQAAAHDPGGGPHLLAWAPHRAAGPWVWYGWLSCSTEHWGARAWTLAPGSTPPTPWWAWRLSNVFSAEWRIHEVCAVRRPAVPSQALGMQRTGSCQSPHSALFSAEKVKTLLKPLSRYQYLINHGDHQAVGSTAHTISL